MKKLLAVLAVLVTTLIFTGCSKEVSTPKNEAKKAYKSSKKLGMSGKSIYQNKCHKTSMRFSTPKEAKIYLNDNRVCDNLSKEELHKVAFYLSGKGKGMKCSSGKCGAGKCGGAKKPKPMKCAAGKCGGGKCGK